MISMLVLT
jgi:hypothetical protein